MRTIELLHQGVSREDLLGLEVMQSVGHLLGEVQGLLPVLVLEPQLGEL